MIINWIRKQKNWAYGNLCNHIAAKMPKHDHVFDQASDGDVNFVVSPGFLKFSETLGKTVLHIDSNRWLTEKEEG